MPHNVPDEWTESMIASPSRDDPVACGLWRRGYVCDPNQYLSQHGEKSEECEEIANFLFRFGPIELRY